VDSQLQNHRLLVPASVVHDPDVLNGILLSHKQTRQCQFAGFRSQFALKAIDFRESPALDLIGLSLAEL